jgi:hypothetical protein
MPKEWLRAEKSAQTINTFLQKFIFPKEKD